jgi:hypothetical protein
MALSEVLPLVISGQQPQSDFWVATWHNRFFVARDERYTLVHNPSERPRGPAEPPGDVNFVYPAIALFDRQNDPLELNDISHQFPEVTKSMMQRLVDWHQLYATGTSEQEQLNADDAAKLEALGYASATDDEQLDIFAPWPPHRWSADSN